MVLTKYKHLELFLSNDIDSDSHTIMKKRVIFRGKVLDWEKNNFLVGGLNPI